ncbi:MAG: GNAT family N-acetyltransferase, partial [Rhodocyclaceae bacterium]|nr:GNAT family N-acetyltransferase [Rhodocyclaceae bacterium]
MNELKENILWRALAGAQQGFATGGTEALRYAPGFPPLVAFADYARPNLGAIEPFCEPGEHLYCAGWSGASPVGWQVEAETSMFRMVWAGPMPAVDEAPDAVQLGGEYADQALELGTLTRPGPLGRRTVEL